MDTDGNINCEPKQTLPLIVFQATENMLTNFLPLKLDWHSCLAGWLVASWQKSVPLNSDIIPHCCKVSYYFLQQCLYIVTSNRRQGLAFRYELQALRIELFQKRWVTEPAAVSQCAAGVFAELGPPQLQGWPVERSIWPAELLTLNQQLI